MNGSNQYEFWPRNGRPVDPNQFGFIKFGIPESAILEIYGTKVASFKGTIDKPAALGFGFTK